MRHSDTISQSFGPAAAAYLESSVHAQGAELESLGQLIAATPRARVLDLGCGAGHTSFAVAPFAAEVVAYDLTDEMLEVVKAEAARRGFGNLQTQRGSAEALPFANTSFDWVVSRYSAHHWRNITHALKEVRRVLKTGGRVCFIDIAGGHEPLFDTYLQAVEVLRDPSHVRDYTEQEWLALLENADFEASVERRWRVPIEFASWIKRIGTPEERTAAIRSLWNAAPIEVRESFNIQQDFSFELDAVILTGKIAVS
ncbi:MAG TPA: class I SAM-dependent methyltransferase [Pseudacidobacterium sp.]|jgi:ubiquinone/menaquinone biosynthesis C-methylase UbiE|nr:class I SAM-dependent methyltransferase [Pseudacidobacterium sp.]